MEVGGCDQAVASSQGGAGFEAAVEDADETVADLAEGGVVADIAGAFPVVVRAYSGRGTEGCEGLDRNAAASRLFGRSVRP
ncbi:hypothetical protein GCM10010271_55250 [Streptomyces kurssanovii]|nr:hypothetical protein GCM10010271_55250 [Streptomyces kurssanovii]